MIKQEAKEHTKVSAWMRSFLKESHACAVEVKHSRGKDSIPFNALEEHQRIALQAVFTTGLVFKIPDGAYQKLPFDLFAISNSLAFVAVRFPKFIAIISIHVWCMEEQDSVRKSLTSERARKIAYDVIECA